MGSFSLACAHRSPVVVPFFFCLIGLMLAGCGNQTAGPDASNQFGAAPKEEAPAAKPELVAKLREMGAGVELDDQGRIVLVTHREGGFKNDDLRLFSDLEHIETLRILGGEIQMSGGTVPPKVTDEGLAHLSGLTSLKKLNLSNTGVTDDGMPHLGQLTNLEQLVLTGTGISDAGLEHLANLRRLRYLDLSSTRVTDAGLPGLEVLPNLHTLDIHSTAVTDAGLEHVKQMKGLAVLDITDCPGISDAAIEEIRKTLPKCDVVR